MSIERLIGPFLPFLRESGAAAAVLRADGVCVFASAALEALYARPLDGKHVLATYPELRGAGLFERLDDVTRRGHTFASPALSVLVAGRDGSDLRPAVLDVVITPLRAPDSEEVLGAMLVARPLHDAASGRSLLLARERNARRIAEAHARRLARLQSTTAALADAITVEDIGEVITGNVVGAFGRCRAVVFATRDGEPQLHLVASSDLSDEQRRALGHVPLDASVPAAFAARTGGELFLESREEFLALFPAPFASPDIHASTQAVACAPLRRHREVVGALGMRFEQPRRFSSEDRAFFRSLADLCGEAMHRAALYEAERRAKEEALAASRVKDEFLATLSHELRTPLQSILGWARLLRTDLDAKATAKAVESIDRSAKTQARLIAEILDASRVVSGRMHVDKRAIRLRDVVANALDTLRPEMEAKGLELDATFEDVPEVFFGDAGRLQQVVLNLVTNALKFTRPGGRIEVSLRGGDPVELRVRDDGAGIPLDFLPFVFERFRQAKGGTTRAHGGLGLGLAIVRHIVELHGGTVTAESEGEGKGATFTVRLPAREGAPPSTSGVYDPSSTDVSRLAVTPILEGVRVLVVDDDEGARELVASSLERFGATAFATASALEALRVLSEVRPRAIVSDLGMPEVDGYEMMRRIRARGPDDPPARVPALALTAYAREIERQRALDAGFQMHLSKPIDPLELARAVQALLS